MGRREGALHAPDRRDRRGNRARGSAVSRRAPGDLEGVRERLYASMWDDAGIVRDAASLARARDARRRSRRNSTPVRCRQVRAIAAYNLSWHDWLNLGSLVAVSRAIVRAAQARENSRGAHYRADFPDPGDPAEVDVYPHRRKAAARWIEQVPVRSPACDPANRWSFPSKNGRRVRWIDFRQDFP